MRNLRSRPTPTANIERKGGAHRISTEVVKPDWAGKGYSSRIELYRIVLEMKIRPSRGLAERLTRTLFASSPPPRATVSRSGPVAVEIFAKAGQRSATGPYRLPASVRRSRVGPGRLCRRESGNQPGGRVAACGRFFSTSFRGYLVDKVWSLPSRG